MSEKLTPWFAPEIKPVREGVYIAQPEIGPDMSPIYSYWNGEYWCIDSFSMNRAGERRIRSYLQKRVWRGLAKKPK
jgi:hypothetical protein